MAARKSASASSSSNTIIKPPKTGLSTNMEISSKKLMEYLRNHLIKKDGAENAVLEKTNTRIGDQEKKIFGGTYHIEDDEYINFLTLYHQEVIQKGAAEYLTEKQLSRGGPILIDIDFRHNNNYDLYHGKKPIEDIIPDNVFESSLLLVEKN